MTIREDMKEAEVLERFAAVLHELRREYPLSSPLWMEKMLLMLREALGQAEPSVLSTDPTNDIESFSEYLRRANMPPQGLKTPAAPTMIDTLQNIATLTEQLDREVYRYFSCMTTMFGDLGPDIDEVMEPVPPQVQVSGAPLGSQLSEVVSTLRRQLRVMVGMNDIFVRQSGTGDPIETTADRSW